MGVAFNFVFGQRIVFVFNCFLFRGGAPRAGPLRNLLAGRRLAVHRLAGPRGEAVERGVRRVPPHAGKASSIGLLRGLLLRRQLAAQPCFLYTPFLFFYLFLSGCSRLGGGYE